MGYLTMEQMQRAAQRYRLGMARDGGVIFWQVDQLGNIYDGKAYALWYGIAQQAQRLLGQPVTVSPLLELNATAEQKAAKIDLVDMLFTPH